jgi:hypothetical protein
MEQIITITFFPFALRSLPFTENGHLFFHERLWNQEGGV